MDTRRDGSPLLESAVEAHLERQMRKIGGRAFKFAPAVKGNPDRIVVFPFGRVYFVELKRKGKKPEPAQALWHARLREMGHVVHVLDTREKVNDFVAWGVKRAMLDDDTLDEEIAARNRDYKEES